jgi:uncharacterized RDD family membrane protein YckC
MTPPTDEQVRTSLDEILIDAAVPDIYRINAFRLMELPVDCSEMDISRRQKIIDISQKNNAPIPPGQGRALPLSTKLDSFAYTDAVQRMRDPERRFVDEFFWFWPHELGESKSDEALIALRSGDDELAVQTWTDYANSYSSENVSVHNLAVMAHVMALDIELSLNGNQPTDSQVNKLNIYWKQALTRFQGLLKVDTFWQRLERRVKEFDDPRLDSSTVTNMLVSLPLGLLMINARLAVQAAERSDQASVQRHITIMRNSGFDSSVVEDALLRATEPARARIKSLCKNAQEQANADAAHADRVTTELLDNCEPLINMLALMLAEDSPVLQTIRDEVALSGLSGQILYGNKTEDWAKSLELVQRVYRIASSQSAKDRIKQNLDTVSNNVKAGNNWTSPGYYDLPPDLFAQIEKARTEMEARRFDSALKLLETLRKSPDLTPEQMPIVLKAMAYTLNQNSQDRLARASEELNQPRTVIKRIQERAGKNDSNFAMTLMWVLGGQEQTAAQSGSLYCMACGSKIYQQWYTFTYKFGDKDIKVLICSSCGAADNSEMEGRRTRFRNAMSDCARELLRAQDLDPNNHIIQDNLDTLYKLGRDVNIPLPARRKPGKPEEKETQKAVKAATTAGASAGNYLANASGWDHFGAYFVDMLVGGIIAGLVTGLTIAILGSSSSSSQSNPVIYGAFAITIFLYYILLYAGKQHRTLGERASRTQVYNLDGETTSLGRMSWRTLCYALMFLVSFLIPGFGWLIFLVPLLNKDRRGLQDFASGTILRKLPKS